MSLDASFSTWRCNMNQGTKYELHRYICPPKDGMTKYAFEYSNTKNGRMVAHLVVKVYDTAIYFDELFVMPYARRKHLASKMLEEAIKLRKDQIIYLDCYTDNDPALSLYKKFGFEIYGEYELFDATLYHMKKG